MPTLTLSSQLPLPPTISNHYCFALCPATTDGFGPSSTWCFGWWMRSIWWLIYTSIKSYFMTTVFFNCSVPHPYIIHCWSMLHHALLPLSTNTPPSDPPHHLPTHSVTTNPTLDVSSPTIPKTTSSTSTTHNGAMANHCGWDSYYSGEEGGGLAPQSPRCSIVPLIS